MVGRYYRLDLFLRALRSGRPTGALRLAWQLARTQLLWEWKCVYGLGVSELDRVPRLDIPGYRVEALSGIAEVRQLDEELRPHPGLLLGDDCWRLHALGATFWVGRFHGELANIGVSRQGTPTREYFWPLLSNHVRLSHFGTVPWHRGRGLYPVMLAHIVRQLAREPVECFLIECGDWNTGSRRGIERAGFRHLGHGRITRHGRLSWYPLESPPGTAPTGAEPRPARRPAEAAPAHAHS